MSRVKKGKSDKNPDTPFQASAPDQQPVSFDELVVEGSLPPVTIRITSKRKNKLSSADENLLLELQCEV